MGASVQLLAISWWPPPRSPRKFLHQSKILTADIFCRASKTMTTQSITRRRRHLPLPPCQGGCSCRTSWSVPGIITARSSAIGLGDVPLRRTGQLRSVRLQIKRLRAPRSTPSKDGIAEPADKPLQPEEEADRVSHAGTAGRASVTVPPDLCRILTVKGLV